MSTKVFQQLEDVSVLELSGQKIKKEMRRRQKEISIRAFRDTMEVSLQANV